MQIGNIREFQQQQLSKVEKCKKEEERIKRGIYRTKVMIDSQCSETFSKECERNRKRADSAKEEKDSKGEKQQNFEQLDIQEEMEKMIAAAGNINFK